MYFTKGFGFGRVSNERQTAFPVPGAADAENALPHRVWKDLIGGFDFWMDPLKMDWQE